ncbi:hypothetical protein V2G26_013888 [Clonostachys chloroleuca]
MGGEKSVGTPGLVPREKLPSKIIRREQARAFWDMRDSSSERYESTKGPTPQYQSVKATEHALLKVIYYLKQAAKYHEQKNKTKQCYAYGSMKILAPTKKLRG